MPINFHVKSINSNSAVVSWSSGSNGGEHQKFLLNVNNRFNITVDNINANNEYENVTVEIKSKN